MKKITILVCVWVVAVSVGDALSQQDRRVVGPRRPKTVEQPRDECGPGRQVVEIRAADPAVDKAHHDLMRDTFIKKARQPNTTILLGPNIVLDFSDIPEQIKVEEGRDPEPTFPIQIGRCVTIRSVAWFGPSPADVAAQPDGTVIMRVAPRSTPSPTGTG